MCRGHAQSALDRYLQILQKRTGSDVVTCYVADAREKMLRLVFFNGVNDTDRVRGHVRSTDVGWRVLERAPRFVVDAEADSMFAGSDFRRREGIRSLCYLP